MLTILIVILLLAALRWAAARDRAVPRKLVP